ncbi:MAG: hypothetical protein AAGH78_04640 [Cyanobacteria bacterium P01_H01_bin.58]
MRNENGDESRSLKLVDYILCVLLRLPKRSRTQYGKFKPRGLGDYVCGIPFDDKNVATDHGNKFLAGKKTKTIGQLVAILNQVRKRITDKYVIEQRRGDNLQTNVSPPTDAQLLEALQIFTRLTREEIHLLGLPAHCQHPLLQQAFIHFATRPVSEGQKLPDVYRQVYQLSLTKENRTDGEQTLSNRQAIEGYIQKEIEDIDDQQKVKNAINRLLLQAGTGQARFLAVDDQERYIQQYLNSAFLDRFIQIVLTNNKLTREFPIYLKKITLESVGPFPVPVPSNDPDKGVLSKTLLVLRSRGNVKRAPVDQLFPQLPTRSVMRVTGHFYIRLNARTIQPGKDYRGFLYKVHKRMRDQVGDKVRVHFTVTSTGIGGTNSQITKALNGALLTDIDGLREDYFPIAHDVFIKQINVNQRVLSPVISHSFVHLCHNETIAQAMQVSCKDAGICRYEDFSGHSPRGEGNYSNFDTLRSSANAALLARLQAISNTGIDPENYVAGLLARIEQQYLLDEAKAYVSSYPFSSFAQESWIQTHLLDEVAGQQRSDSHVLYNARLTIAETFLSEGAYRNAYPHLRWLKERLHQDSEDGITWLTDYDERQPQKPSQVSQNEVAFKVVSGQILTRYEICLANYLTTIDEELEQEMSYFLDLFNRTEVTQTDLIEEAWRRLTRAEQHLTVRMIKYHIVDEVSQATFQPYYQLLAQIYLHRARLFIWHPSLVAPNNAGYRPPTQASSVPRSDPKHACWGRLFLLERARVYAACDGDSSLYVTCTANQCWAWLMTAFVMPQDGLDDDYLAKENCLSWAWRLRNHALLHYAAIGQSCYHTIKEKSGLSEELIGNLAGQRHIFGNYRIDPIPVIRETIGEDNPGYHAASQVLYLDMGYLAVRRGEIDSDNPESTESIYLFGPQACYLFFIRGLYHLCSDDKKEFDKSTPVGKNSKQELSLQEWDKKLEKCYRLFTYAWAIADDGCAIDQNPTHDGHWHIMRYENKSNGEKNDKNEGDRGIPDAHAASVWDLYPHRVTEIADLGKLFAAVCAVLRLYTAYNPQTHQQEHQKRHREIQGLLDRLPITEDFYLAPNLKKALHNQHRYNGHIATYLRQSAKKIMDMTSDVKGELLPSEIANEKDKLLTQIFDLDAL